MRTIRKGTKRRDVMRGKNNDGNLYGFGGNDSLFGNGGNDILFGGTGDDLLSGGDGNDLIFGDRGDDIMQGDRGRDRLFGGSGNDRMIWNDGDGSDLINGGNDTDVVEVNGANAAGDEFVLTGFGRKAIFDRVNLVPFRLTTENVEEFEINGGGGNDRLVVNNLQGTGVNQVLFIAGEGNDTLDGSNTTTRLIADGGSGDDTLVGGSADDALGGSDGNDDIEGEKGNDIMVGGAGNDTLGWDDGDGSDLMSGGDGIDTIEVEGSVLLGDSFTLVADGTKAIFDRVNLVPFKLTVDTSELFDVEGLGGDDLFDINDLTGTDVTAVSFSGGDGNDVLDASETSTPITAKGDAGDDTLTGGNGIDSLDGGTGNDRLLGGNGDDTLSGGDGNDVIVGNRGGDTMIGGNGDDRLIWNNGDGSDLMLGDAGTDVIEVNGAATGADQFVLNASGGQAIFDRLNLVPFKLTTDNAEQFEVNGLGGDDSFEVNDLTGSEVVLVTFTGGDGNDSFDGQDATVQLVARGDAGDDLLKGGTQNDRLSGGSGNDILTGNAGADSFLFQSNAPFSTADFGIDTITDFLAGTDKLVLDQTTFGAIALTDIAIVANDANAATTNKAIAYSSSTGNLFFNQDGNGAGFGTGGQFATLTGAPALSVNDFVIQA